MAATYQSPPPTGPPPTPMDPGLVKIAITVIVAGTILLSIYLIVSHAYPKTKIRKLSPVHQWFITTIFVIAFVVVMAALDKKLADYLADNPQWYLFVAGFTFIVFIGPTISRQLKYRERDPEFVEMKMFEFLGKPNHGNLKPSMLGVAPVYDIIIEPKTNQFGEIEPALDVLIEIEGQKDVNIVMSQFGECKIYEFHTKIDAVNERKRRSKESIKSKDITVAVQHALTDQQIVDTEA